MPWFPKYTKPTLLKPSTTWRAVSRLWSNDKEPKFAKSITGIPEVSTLPLNTVPSDRDATGGRNKALETAALAQDNIVLGKFLGGSQVVITDGVYVQRPASSGLICDHACLATSPFASSSAEESRSYWVMRWTQSRVFPTKPLPDAVIGRQITDIHPHLLSRSLWSFGCSQCTLTSQQETNSIWGQPDN